MKWIQNAIGLSLTIGAVCSVSAATPLQEGISKFFLQDYSGAQTSFEQAADGGVADASYYLGLIYRDQYNDAYNAFNHFETASKLSHTISQLELGVMYATGVAPVAKDINQAKYWFKNAQLKDRSGIAAYWLHTFETDSARIIALLTEASDMGHAEATRKLSDAYLNGDYGLSVDTAKGNELLQLATDFAE